jgi:two-component system NtrC family response regulator
MKVDVRLVAATHRDLARMVAEGRFREDLFYRLNVVHIGIPPLRERQEDIRLLVNHFLQKYAAERKSAVPVRGVAQEVDRLFYDYSWPGNVRELENVIERVMILCPNEIITGDDLPRGFKSSLDNALHIDGIPANAKLYETLEMVEKTMIQRALKMADNVQSHAAAILGIGKSGLNQKIKKYNLEVGAKS